MEEHTEWHRLTGEEKDVLKGVPQVVMWVLGYSVFSTVIWMINTDNPYFHAYIRAQEGNSL